MEQARVPRSHFLMNGLTWASLATLAGTAYSALVEPTWLDVSRVPLTLPRLPAEFHGYRIVQVSDIHIGDWMNADRLAQVIHQVNAQSADLVAITGDFISRRPGAHAHDLACGLGRLQA